MNTDVLKTLDVYTPLEDIRGALKSRRQDQDLKDRVASFFGDDYPAFLDLPDAQYAFFCRPVITPNKELTYFLEIADTFKLQSRLLEYPGKFVSKNREKRYAAKICANGTAGKNGGENMLSATLIDFSEAEGEPFAHVITRGGENLIAQHHKLLFQKYPNSAPMLSDITTWFENVRKKYSHYYLAFLALSIRNGVHFENFIESDPDEFEFFKEKVAPSFEAAERLFGVRPLIYPLLPLEHEKSPKWLYYSKEDITFFSGDTGSA